MKPTSLGQQYLVDFYDCTKGIYQVEDLREHMLAAARIANATIVKDVFHTFNPHGISGVVVIAESHLAIHTWPEHACAALDLFTCSPAMDALAAIEYLRKAFLAQDVAVHVQERGHRLRTRPQSVWT